MSRLPAALRLLAALLIALPATLHARPPVVTSVSFAPDGRSLVVSGAGEALVLKADTLEVTARLRGEASRVEAARFSPDGSRVAVAAGSPGEGGVLQIWDAKTGELVRAIDVGEDTIYGAAWSPDGRTVAVGLGDTTVQAFDAATGGRTLLMGSHDGWPIDLVYSVDGSRLASVGRDMTVKLTEVATERFIDNVTSITPGALKGGLSSIARHPARDEVLVGGSDGEPKTYRLERLTKRVIGDDAQLVRRLPAQPGRVFGVAYAPDGLRAAAVSSLDGRGTLVVTDLRHDLALPDDLKTIHEKRVQQWNAEERAAVEAYVAAGVSERWRAEADAALYAVAFSPDGLRVVAAGADGRLRAYHADTGAATAVVELPGREDDVADEILADHRRPGHERSDDEPGVDVSQVDSLAIEPAEVTLAGPFETTQLIVTATMADGTTADVTRLATLEIDSASRGRQSPEGSGRHETSNAQGTDVPCSPACVTSSGLVLAGDDGSGTLTATLGEAAAAAPVTVAGVHSDAPLSYARDVTPVLSKLGCNQGTCHGAKDGKGDFKLSLRGYDAIYDVRALTDDLKSRRVDVADPARSLMLSKAAGYVAHGGNTLAEPGEDQFEVIRRWITEGAKLDEGDWTDRKPTGITISPTNPVIQQIGTRQQLRVVATYADGSTRDVTADAFVTSGNTEVAEVSGTALVQTVRRGEAPMLARYEGRYAATTVTVMGDRSGFEWRQPETWGRIDELTAAKWRRMKILPSGLSDDAAFLRRVHLDLTGLPPTPDEVRAFLADDAQTRAKRDAVVDRLIGSPAFVDHWTNKWADLLSVNRKFLGPEGARLYRDWIREQVEANRPYDAFVRDIVTASGSNRANPAASYYKVLRDPLDTMENTTHLFLAVRFNCNKCHDHPFERWTQDQYYETAAYFGRLGLKDDAESSKGKTIGGSAVEKGKPLYEVVFEKGEGEVTHDRTGAVTAPTFPYDADIDVPAEGNRRERLAAWMTSPENDYFAASYVNRLWGYLNGRGLIDPLDDIRAGNPPSNPELLDYLTDEFVDSGFDVRHLLRLIVTSRTYQLSVATNEWNADDATNYSHATARRLPAETLFDAVHAAVGSTPDIPGVAKGTAAVALPDSGVKLADGFLDNFGRPARESACECERSNDINLGPVMALVSGPTIGQAVTDDANDLAALVENTPDDAALVRELFLRVLARPATDEEVAASVGLFAGLDADHDRLLAERAAYAAEIAPLLAAEANARDEAIILAQAAVIAREVEIAPEEARKDDAQKAAVAKAEAALANARKTALEGLPAWAAAQSEGPQWEPLTFAKMTAKASKFETLPDGSILTSGGKDNNEQFVLDLPAAAGQFDGVTGLKIEALPHESLPNLGPGRGGGNFVLGEMRLQTKGADGQFKTLAFDDAWADFSQGGYDVKTAIDGQLKKRTNNGWAISPQTGKPHWATFKLKEPLAAFGPGTLRVVLTFPYQDGRHILGRFRVSLTRAADALQPGLPQDVAEALAAEERTDAQTAAIAAYLDETDEPVLAARKTLANASKPRPVDAELARLRRDLARVERPLPEDPKLARLDRAVALSAAQLKTPRLTAAQDVTWALINSPAFLFNH